jgi:hypothetical protein
MSLKFVMPILVILRADYKYIALDSLPLSQAQVILSDHLDVSLRNVGLPFAFGLFGFGCKFGR